MRRGLRATHVVAIITVAACLVLLLLISAFTIPRALYPQLSPDLLDSLSLGGKDRLDAQNERIRLQNDTRATLLQGVGGLIILVGAGIGASVSLAQIQVSREGQVVDRFTRAVDQLGDEMLEVRLGGIYALEAIAANSTRDRAPVAEVLSAYIHSHAPWPPIGPRQPSVDTSLDDLRELRTHLPDVQAAMSILGRHSRSWHSVPYLRIRYVDLRRVSLAGADFAGADMSRSHFERGWLNGANFEEAYLRLANFERARLRNANLRRANLKSACFRDAELDGADLVGATSNKETVWPRGFDPNSAGVVLED